MLNKQIKHQTTHLVKIKTEKAIKSKQNVSKL